MDRPLNNLVLDNAMLAALYGHSLVEIAGGKEAPVKKKKEKTTSPFRHLGNNAKRITILVKNPGHPFLPEDQLTFLTQILTACKLGLDDVAIVNMAHDNPVMENIVGELKPEHILSFGTGSGTELFRMENREGTKYLNAPDLSEMMQDNTASKQLKGKLWNELKSIFSIR